MSFTIQYVPELRSTVCHVSLLSPVAHVCRDIASCLWRGLSRSSEPTHKHLSATNNVPKNTSYSFRQVNSVKQVTMIDLATYGTLTRTVIV